MLRKRHQRCRCHSTVTKPLKLLLEYAPPPVKKRCVHLFCAYICGCGLNQEQLSVSGGRWPLHQDCQHQFTAQANALPTWASFQELPLACCGKGNLLLLSSICIWLACSTTGKGSKQLFGCRQLRTACEMHATSIVTCKHAAWQWRASCQFERQLLRLALQHGSHPVHLTGLVALRGCYQHVHICNHNLQSSVK